MDSCCEKKHGKYQVTQLGVVTHRLTPFINMPLIHFLAVTASIAMCFVAAETETMYRIAVSQFKDL
jgi:hypothetical protein